jgi:hypothetical protein
MASQQTPEKCLRQIHAHLAKPTDKSFSNIEVALYSLSCSQCCFQVELGVVLSGITDHGNTKRPCLTPTPHPTVGAKHDAGLKWKGAN